MDNILYLFHHIHHRDGEHEVHHCGGQHKDIDEKINYTIWHCGCSKHAIDREVAIGHATGADLKVLEVDIKFTEICPEGGWHVESGERI